MPGTIQRKSSPSSSVKNAQNNMSPRYAKDTTRVARHLQFLKKVFSERDRLPLARTVDLLGQRKELTFLEAFRSSYRTFKRRGNRSYLFSQTEN